MLSFWSWQNWCIITHSNCWFDTYCHYKRKEARMHYLGPVLISTFTFSPVTTYTTLRETIIDWMMSLHVVVFPVMLCMYNPVCALHRSTAPCALAYVNWHALTILSFRYLGFMGCIPILFWTQEIWPMCNQWMLAQAHWPDLYPEKCPACSYPHKYCISNKQPREVHIWLGCHWPGRRACPLRGAVSLLDWPE